MGSECLSISSHLKTKDLVKPAGVSFEYNTLSSEIRYCTLSRDVLYLHGFMVRGKYSVYAQRHFPLKQLLLLCMLLGLMPALKSVEE